MKTPQNKLCHVFAIPYTLPITLTTLSHNVLNSFFGATG